MSNAMGATRFTDRLIEGLAEPMGKNQMPETKLLQTKPP